MNKLLAIALALSVSGTALAGGLISSDPTYNTPVANAGASANQAQGQGQAQGQQQGQLQGQGQAQGQTSVNTNANANLNGNTNLNVVEGSKATSGSNSNAVGDVSVSTVTNETYEVAASSAASVMIASCQQGGSGSALKGGLGFASDSPQCAALRQAAIDFERAELYARIGDTEKSKAALESYEANVAQAEQSQEFRQVFGNIGGFIIDILPVAALAFLL